MAGKSLNKVMLIGNLGRDPEVKYLPSGQAVANFTMATNERFKDKEGEWRDRTEWHKIVFFGKIAETIGQYLNKGSRIYVEGRLQTRSYEQDGQKKYITEVVGRDMIMLGGRGDSGGGGGGYSDEPSYEPTPAPEDDIPF